MAVALTVPLHLPATQSVHAEADAPLHLPAVRATHVPTVPQWWSWRATQKPHSAQCEARRGRQMWHVVQKRAPSPRTHCPIASVRHPSACPLARPVATAANSSSGVKLRRQASAQRPGGWVTLYKTHRGEMKPGSAACVTHKVTSATAAQAA